jgi:hypothetical protein
MGSVLNVIASIFKWALNRRQENLEDGVLDAFRGELNWPWLSAFGVVARMKHNAAYQYASVALQSRPHDGLLLSLGYGCCRLASVTFLIGSTRSPTRKQRTARCVLFGNVACSFVPPTILRCIN